MLGPERVSLVRNHVEEILASHAFSGSRKTQDFLRLIISHALEGDVESLRERVLGAEMYGRPISYDTGSDAVVRVRASDLRKKLAQFYSDPEGRRSTIRIEVPSGTYVPRFHFPAEKPAAQAAPHDETATDNISVQPPQPLPTQHAPLSSGTVSGSEATEHPTASSRNWLRWGGFSALAVVVLGLGYLGVRRWSATANAPKGIHSIVILPLENLAGDPAQDYFADGMTEELINNLGQVSTLRVISLTSSMSYKGTKKKLPEIARELSVDAAVEGGILRDGNQVRVSTQLVDAHTDRPIWTHTYVRDLSGVQAWQGEVAQTIAQEISTKITPDEQARLSTAGQQTTDPAAQDLYLHGILLRNQGNCQQAIGYFNNAIARSSGYALAHSALASCYGLMGESGQLPYEEAFTRQKAEATRAIELDDSISEAHAELANTAMTLDWDWPHAAAEFHRALELNPNSATNHEKYAFYLVRTGQLSEALTETQRAVDLDPISESTFHAEGFVYFFSRQYDQALGVARTVKGLNIDLPDWSFLLGDIYAEKGLYPESIAAFLKAGNGPYALGHLGNVYARAGKTAAAKQIIARLEDQVSKNGIGRYEIALVYAGLNDKANAFKWLEDAYQAHDVGLVYLKVDPCLDLLRSDPHYHDLLHRVGLDHSS